MTTRPPLATRATLAIFAALAATSLPAGCGFKGGDMLTRNAGRDVWRPRPHTMRVYPSTRFIASDGDTFLDARVELLDEMGDSIKGAGEFRLELFAAAAGRTPQAGRDPGRRLYAWQVPMRTLDQQQRFYDTITRAYHLRLRIDDAAHAQAASLLRVTFLPATDAAPRLEAEAVVGGVDAVRR